MAQNIVLSSSKLDEEQSNNSRSIVELLLPIRIFWEAEKIVDFTYYLQSSNEPPVRYKQAVMDLLDLVIPYITSEADRNIMIQKRTGKKPIND